MSLKDIQVTDKDEATYTFHSLDDFATEAERIVASGASFEGKSTNRGTFYAATTEQALEYAHNGWDKHLPATLTVAEEAVALCERDHEVMRPEMTYDVSGDSVDIGRYLAGEPECMVDYPLSTTSVAGRVVALCASVSYSAAINADVIVARGQVITALALALSQLGHACELWADFSGKDYSGNVSRFRVLVKSADDTLDPARILFAYSHPAMLRRLGFIVEGNQPGQWSDMCPSNTRPIAPKQDLPDGTLYLPEVCSGTNIPNAHEELKKHLRALGLLAES